MLALTIFLGAFLLFQVQPIMGRFILPWFGGGPMVWTICMLFFQALLVCGYAYAHWLGSLRKPALQAYIHIGLLAASLAFLPIDPRGTLFKDASSSDPSGRILLVLILSVGGPYFMLSSTGPLLQRWFHWGRSEGSPWRLYALSNIASFLALLTYPFAVEPYLTLRIQSWTWSGLYTAFAAASAWVAWTFRSAAERVPVGESRAAPRPSLSSILLWIALAATGSILLLATTNLLCQDIAVVPFLWIAPLSIYLLTFVLVFESDRWYRRTLFAVAAGLLVPAGCVSMVAAVGVPLGWQLAIFLATLFVTCMICQGELAMARPEPANLTAFYLAIAAGGALGGLFVAILSPHIFTDYSEYPIGLAAACILAFIRWAATGVLRQWNTRNLAVRVALMALLIGAMTALLTATKSGNSPAIAKYRNFYGILRVFEREDSFHRPYRELNHGSIRHGFQYRDSSRSALPTTYYGPHSGIGIILNSLTEPGRRVAVIGLGAGTLAAWGRPGDTFRFYEINPDVVKVAGTWFSYLKNSTARTEIVLGDARVELERELARAGSKPFDVIAVDAFSGDAIPLHLLTAECGDVYRRHLKPGGSLLFHISNRLLQLDPVVRGLAGHLKWPAIRFTSPANTGTGENIASWVLVTPNAELLDRPEVLLAASPWTRTDPAPIRWTDDFASLWHVFRL